MTFFQVFVLETHIFITWEGTNIVEYSYSVKIESLILVFWTLLHSLSLQKYLSILLSVFLCSVDVCSVLIKQLVRRAFSLWL